MALTLERLRLVDIPINVSNKPNNLSAFNRSTAPYNDSINLLEAIQLVGGGSGGTGTDLTYTRIGDVFTLFSSTGADTIIPIATTSLAGLLSFEDKITIDNALTYADLNIGSGLTGDGSSGDPLNWIGAVVTSPITGNGITGTPLTILANSITTTHIQTGTILFSDWNQNSADTGNVPQWNGTSWVAAPVALPTGTIGDILLHNGTIWESVSRIKESQTGITGVTVTLATTPIAHGQIDIYKNGILQTYSDDYTRSGAVLTMVAALVSADKITAIYNN